MMKLFLNFIVILNKVSIAVCTTVYIYPSSSKCMLKIGDFCDIVKVKVKSLSRVPLFAIPWTVAYQAPPSVGFSRQECWSRLPFPSPGDLPNPGIEPGSPTLQADALPSEPHKGFDLGHTWMVHTFNLSLTFTVRSCKRSQSQLQVLFLLTV